MEGQDQANIKPEYSGVSDVHMKAQNKGRREMIEEDDDEQIDTKTDKRRRIPARQYYENNDSQIDPDRA